MLALKSLRFLLFLLPGVAFAQQPVAPVTAGADWGWSALTAFSMILILVVLFTLSKAIESLADRVRDKIR